MNKESNSILDLNIAIRENGHFKRLSRYLFYPNLSEAYHKTYHDRWGVSSWDTLDYTQAQKLAMKSIQTAKKFPDHIKVQGSFITETFHEEDSIDRLFKGQKIVLGR